MFKALDEEHAKELGLEKEAVDELTEKYDDLLDFLIVLALNTNIGRQRKLSIASQKFAQYKAFNEVFSRTRGQKAYEFGKNSAYREVGARNEAMSSAQKAEQDLLVKQLNTDVNARLGVYENNFKKLTYKVDLSNLREESLGFTDATDQVFLENGRIKRQELLFLDSKGRRISNKSIMSITAGDSLWDAMESGKRSVYLKLGITKALHISVIDDRTTDICISLHRTIRDLKKDRIPPMHRRCRSKIRAINPETGEIYQKTNQ